MRIEQLESRQLLASQILGTVWNDANADTVQQAEESGLAGWEVFLDTNDNGVHDEDVQTVNSAGPPIAITDLTTVTSTLSVTGFDSPIIDVQVTLNIEHTYDGDLDVFLISPTGTRVELFTDAGGSGDGFTNTTIDDQAPISILSGSAPFTGSFQPEGSLSAFNGEDANGIWTLEVTDDANDDTGQLVSWSLTIRGQGEPKANTDAGGNYSFDQLAAGDYTVRQVVQANWVQTLPTGSAAHSVTLAQDEVLQNVDFGNQSMLAEIHGTVWNDFNSDGVQQAGEPGLAGRVVYIDLNDNGIQDDDTGTFVSTNVPVGFTDLTTVTSEIDVSGFSTAITDIDVTISLEHTFVADLDIFLISPTGTRVELMTDVGGSGDNLSNTTLDDEAATAITSGSAPFAGSFRPEGLLSVFDGENANGIWTLEIADDADVDTGQLLSWSVNISGEGEPSVVTGADGLYAFANLEPGNYAVRQVLPEGATQTFPGAGAAQIVNLAPSQIATNLDFGSRSDLGSISGTVWRDDNADGIRQGSEVALPNWTVYLDENGNGQMDVASLSIASTDPPQQFSDFTTVTSVIDVSGLNSPIVDVNVTVSMEHDLDRDLDVFLVSPTGTRVELFTDVNQGGGNFVDTTLDDEASTLITSASPPYTGSFRPEGSLADFDGEDANGIWTLEVTDDGAADTGQLLGWSLDITADGEPVAVTDANGIYTFAGLTSGTYLVRQVLPANWGQTAPSAGAGHAVALGQGQQATGYDFGNSTDQIAISGTAWNDLNADGIRNAGEVGIANREIYIDENNNGVLDQERVTVLSDHLDLPIPDQGIITSDLVVGGFGSAITDVNVTLHIVHTYDADLDVFIISPSGTRVELFTDVGGSGDNFFNTTLDDQTDTPITTGAAPFVWSFQPEGTLADFNGEDPNGTWTLEITDDAAVDVGELHEWSIQITGDGEPLVFTESDGSYSFTDLPAGTYVVRQVLPAFWNETVPADGFHSVQVQQGSVIQGLDFASYNAQPAHQLLPDLVVLADESNGYLYDASIDQSGSQTLLRFSTATANIGEGVANLIGGDVNPDDTQDVFQRIYDTDGGFTERLAGQFFYHEEHNHVHFEGYADYQLRAVTGGGGVGEIVAAADKVSFCLLDSAPHDLSLPGAPQSAQFTDCGTVSQGISVGWVDIYGDHLPGQTIDITGLASGTYWLETVVDPENALLEIDETNNVTRLLLDIDVAAGTVTAINAGVIAGDDSAETSEDTAVTIDVLANDYDPDPADTPLIDGVTQATNGAVVNNGSDVTYTPNTGFAGVDSFTYTVTDGNGSFATATVEVTVVATNGAPTLTAIETSVLQYSAGQGPASVTDTILVDDSDGALLVSAVVQITGNHAPAEDVLAFSDFSNIAGSWDAANGILTLSGSDTLANYETALRSVTYENISGTPSLLTRTVSFSVNDGTIDSLTITRDIEVTATNEAPELSNIETAPVSYLENASPTAITATLAVADPDDVTIVAATVAIANNYVDGQDVLSFTGTQQIAPLWDAANGILTLTGTDTLTNYQTALRNVTYQNVSESPSMLTRTVSFTVNDGANDSLAVTRNISVTASNDAPLLTGIETDPLDYQENSGAVPITATLALADHDDTYIEGATIEITANYADGEDLLGFINTAHIASSWDASNGILTLTGSDTVANYEAALRSVAYENNSESPSELTRAVSFTVNDGTANSVAAVRNIAITPANEAPELSGIEPTALPYAENAGEVPISGTLVVTDAENGNIESATVQFANNYVNGQDELHFVGSPQITAFWDAANGILTLTGSDTVDNYQAALRNVTYRNTSDSPWVLTRTVSIIVNDGAADSLAVTRDIAVTATNDAPELTGVEPTDLAYSENAGSLPITGTLAVADKDDVQIEGATVWISANYQSGEDLLAFTNTAQIAGSWDAANGILTLTGADTLANYQTALRSVSYQNTSESPSVLTRTVSFEVNDGPAESQVVTRDIAVTAANDAPVLTGIEGNVLNYSAEQGPLAVTNSVVVNDLDDAMLLSAIIQITGGYMQGEDLLSFVNTGNITSSWDAVEGKLTLTGSDTVAAYEAALRAVTYENTSPTPTVQRRTISFQVEEDEGGSNEVFRELDIVVT